MFIVFDIRLFEMPMCQVTLQMFTGIYGVFAGKSECRDFRIAGFTCMSEFSINSVGDPFRNFVGKL